MKRSLKVFVLSELCLVREDDGDLDIGDLGGVAACRRKKRVTRCERRMTALTIPDKGPEGMLRVLVKKRKGRIRVPEMSCMLAYKYVMPSPIIIMPVLMYPLTIYFQIIFSFLLARNHSG